MLHLAFTDLEFKTEFIGGSTPEQIKLELTFRELVGSFQEDRGEPSIKFFHVSSGVDGDTASSDDFDWPRIVLKLNPPAVHSILERIAAEEEESDGRYQEEGEKCPPSSSSPTRSPHCPLLNPEARRHRSWETACRRQPLFLCP